MTQPRHYSRVMLGPKSSHAEAALEGGFVGMYYGFELDFTGTFTEKWRDFNAKYIPIFQQNRPDKSKVTAGRACGALWTLLHWHQVGDRLLCPDGRGAYLVGEITGGYQHVPGGVMPHRRSVRWLPHRILRTDMSLALKKSTAASGTLVDINKHVTEIEQLLAGAIPAPAEEDSESGVDDPAVFALEAHLEDFLVRNWQFTSLGKEYDIYEDNGKLIGQQYPTDTGPLDILAISKDKKRLLIIELKKGRASDKVVGQILRYMGFVQEDLAEANQTVHGVIIALEDDLRIRRALQMTKNIEFYRYQVSFELVKG